MQILQLILVGDSGVGKTHIFTRYLTRSVPLDDMAPEGDNPWKKVRASRRLFSFEHALCPFIRPVLQVEFQSIKVKIEGQTKEVQLWDTIVGEEKYKVVTPEYDVVSARRVGL